MAPAPGPAAAARHSRVSARRLGAVAIAAIGLFSILGNSPASDARWRLSADSLAALVPDSVVTVDILTPQYSKQVEGLAVRLASAARRNPEWFQAHTRAHPGGAPPWHPNLGITRAEYTEYLIESRSAPMAVSQRMTLRFVRQGAARRWRLQGWGKLAPLNGLILDLDRNQVEGRRGKLEGKGIAHASATDATPLAWQWYGVWKAAHQTGDAKRGQALQASLHIGPLAKGREVGMYWTYRRFNNGARLDDEFLLLRYARP